MNAANSNNEVCELWMFEQPHNYDGRASDPCSAVRLYYHHDIDEVDDQVTVRHHTTFEFFDEAEFNHWQALTDRIKSKYAHLRAHVSPHLTRSATAARYVEWFALVDSLITLFGKPRVPGDIRDVLNSVESHLGRTLTNWF